MSTPFNSTLFEDTQPVDAIRVVGRNAESDQFAFIKAFDDNGLHFAFAVLNDGVFRPHTLGIAEVFHDRS